jgi:hypothetical protein
MKNPSNPSRGQLPCKRNWSHSVISRCIAAAVLSLLFLGRQSTAQTLPYSENFDTGTAVGWYVLDTLGLMIGQPGSVSFPGGNSYRLEHPAIPSQDYITSVGMARMSSWAPTYTTNHCQVSVDLLDLQQYDLPIPFRQEFGLNVQARTVGSGTTAAYTFHYLPLAGVPGFTDATDGFVIERTKTEVFQSWMGGDWNGTNGLPWYPGCVASQPYHLDPAKDYRLVFMVGGLHLEGRVYDLADLSKPVLITDCDYSGAAGGEYEFTNGLVGIQVQNIYGTNAAAEEGSYTGPCAATVDNFSVSETYSAYPGTPSVPSLSVSSSDGTNIVAWPGETLGLWAMQQSPAIGAGEAWTDVPLWLIEYNAASGLRKHIATNSPMGFYRLRKL